MTVYVATTEPGVYVDPINKSIPIGVALGVIVGVIDCVGVIVYVGVTDCVGVGVGVNNDNAIEFAALTSHTPVVDTILIAVAASGTTFDV